jgi:hypothetical protein
MVKRFVLAAVLLLVLPAAVHAVTVAGTSIESQATITFDGITVTTPFIYATVLQEYGLDLVPTFDAASAAGGEWHYFAMTVTNIGNGSSRVFMGTAASPEGWKASLFVDDNMDGIHQDGENTPVSSSMILAEDANFMFFLKVTASDASWIGTHGYGMAILSAEVNDGPSYFGANGILYGGDDTVISTCDVSIESMGHLRIWRNDKNKDIYLTWGGGPADIYYRSSFGLTFEGGAATIEATNVLSPWTSEAIEAKDGVNRYYRISVTGTSSFAAGILGKFDTPVSVGINQLSLPLLPYGTTISSVIGTQVTGANNAGDADRVWKYNPNVQAYYDFAWLVGGVGPSYDGFWYTGNSSTNLSIEADEGFIVQIRDGHPATCITFVGSACAESRQIMTDPDMNFIGTCYPVDVELNNSNLFGSGATGATNASDADRIWSYNPAAASYYDYAWLADHSGTIYDGTWITGSKPTKIKFRPGKGYWFQRRPGRAAFNWIYTKPY